MTPRVAGLDPEIGLFVTGTSDALARLGAPRVHGWPERRRIANAARAPWRSGGPVMAATSEHRLAADAVPFRVRVHRPHGIASTAPVLVYVHGGGWCMFSIDTHDRLMREYAAAGSVVVVGVDYSLAPEHPFPVAQDQCVEAIAWLREHAAELGIDADRLALGGDSAGANLALTTALRLRDEGHPGVVAALLLNYGCYDPQVSAQAAATLGTKQDMLSVEEMEEFWRNYLVDDTALRANPLVAPVHASLRGLPPTRLACGDRDVLVEQSVAMAARLRAAGVDAELHEYPGAPHSFLEAMAVSQLARDAITTGADWVRRHLQVGAGVSAGDDT